MIQTFVDRFMNNKPQLENLLKKEHPSSYGDLVGKVMTVISSDDYGDIDPKRIHEIDDGEYQGTLLYVIGANGYQPSRYWYVKVDYGSCSGCDTLEAIKDDGDWDKTPNSDQVNQYMTLSLHIVQRLKLMGEDSV